MTTTPSGGTATDAAFPADCRFAYIVMHEAWWAKGMPSEREPSINVMAAANGGGVAWEFGIRDHDLGGHTAIRVEMFDDAFAAFQQIPQFFRRLAGVDTLAEVKELLDELGAIDETERTRP